MLKGDIPIQFDWQNRWLKGEEYAHILTRMEKYSETFDLMKFTQKTHPESIYIHPESNLSFILTPSLIDGMIYFVRGNSIGSDFGFPRLAFKKKYKW